jgi:N-acetylglucosamine kinase-like BadF-type ATPase
VTDNRDNPLPAVLAIDGGNSKTDVGLIADDGTVLASLRGPGVSHEDFGLEEAMRRLGEIVRAVAAQVGRPADGNLVARHTSACLAGADLPEEETMLTAAIGRQGWTHTAAVANDTFAVLRTGLTPGEGEPAWGIAVTCGAGINCVGVGPDGRTTRFLAFGALSGDWGGGLGLGQAALWHAIRAEDGRGEPTELRAAVPAFYRMPSMHEVAVAFHLDKLGEDDLIRLPAVLFASAQAGDAVALSVIERQAEEIVTMAVTAISRLDLAETPHTPVVLGGGVLEARNPLLTDAITRRLAERAPTAVVRIVDAPPVTGAALLGLDHLGAGPAAETRLRSGYARAILPGQGLFGRSTTPAPGCARPHWPRPGVRWPTSTHRPHRHHAPQARRT